jgi:hypothetical protein
MRASYSPQSELRMGFEVAPPLGVASHCPILCSARVAQSIRGILTCRCPRLPLVSHKRSPYSAPCPETGVANKDAGLVRYLT